jgi:hypothetical protein
MSQKSVVRRPHWTDKKKLEVLQMYILLGNLRVACSNANVPEDTVRHWKMTQWWKDLEDELRRGSKLQLSARLSTLVQKSIEAMDDRITNGDFFFNKKTGSFDRKPVSAEHLNKITNTLIDNHLRLEKQGTTEKFNDEGLKDRLDKIREELSRFAKAVPIQGEVLNVVPVETPRSTKEYVTEEVSREDQSAAYSAAVTNATGAGGDPGTSPSDTANSGTTGSSSSTPTASPSVPLHGGHVQVLPVGPEATH